MRSPPPQLKAAGPPPQEGGVIVLNQKNTSLLRGRSGCFEPGWGRAAGAQMSLCKSYVSDIGLG